jgi:hypothetical protein
MLAREAHDLLAPLRDRGHMDVLREFAGPFAARTLKLLLGLDAARDDDLEFASQAFIDGVGNYADDAETWQRCARGNRLVDDAITADWDRAEDGNRGSDAVSSQRSCATPPGASYERSCRAQTRDGRPRRSPVVPAGALMRPSVGRTPPVSLRPRVPQNERAGLPRERPETRPCSRAAAGSGPTNSRARRGR